MSDYRKIAIINDNGVVLGILGQELRVIVDEAIDAEITNFPSDYAKETGGNLASIKTNTDKIPSKGQATMANSTPVALASDQSSITITHGKTIKTVSGSLTSDTDVIAAVANKRIKVIAYSLTSQGINQNSILFKSNGTGGTELWRVSLQTISGATSGANLAIAAPSFLFATIAGEKLTIDVSQTDTVHYSISYFDDDAS